MKQNWRSFTRSVLSMMTEILLKQAMVGMSGYRQRYWRGCWWRRIRVRRYSHSGRCGENSRQPGDLREPAGRMSQRDCSPW
ncbi:phage tail tape measure C-terminal domain-containing protein [Shigella sonnei]